ncbi:hypothetical protein HOA64_02840 [bacterium]|nr:hypothetical protein [bacterium]
MASATTYDALGTQKVIGDSLTTNDFNQISGTVAPLSYDDVAKELYVDASNSVVVEEGDVTITAIGDYYKTDNDFTQNNYLADGDGVYAALEKLDLQAAAAATLSGLDDTTVQEAASVADNSTLAFNGSTDKWYDNDKVTITPVGNVYITGTLDVDGATTTDGITDSETIAAQAATVALTLDVDGATTTDGITNDGNIITTGDFFVGSVGLGDSDATDGASLVGYDPDGSTIPLVANTVADALDALAALVSNNALLSGLDDTTVQEAASVADNSTLAFNGTSNLWYDNSNFTVTAAGAGDFASNLAVGGTLDATGATTLSSTLDVTGATNLNATTASTTYTTGALIVDGGVGIAKDLFVNSDIDVLDTLTAGDIVIDEAAGTLAFTGATSGTISGGGAIVIQTDGGSIANNPAADFNVTTTDGGVNLAAGGDHDILLDAAGNYVQLSADGEGTDLDTFGNKILNSSEGGDIFFWPEETGSTSVVRIYYEDGVAGYSAANYATAVTENADGNAIPNKEYVDNVVGAMAFSDLTDGDDTGRASGNLLFWNGSSDWVDTTLVMTEGTNTFNFANGTSSLDVAAGVAVNIDNTLTVQGDTSITAATTISGATSIASAFDVAASSAVDINGPLTVESGATSIINQDVTTDADVEFDIVRSETLDLETLASTDIEAGDCTVATAGQIKYAVIGTHDGGFYGCTVYNNSGSAAYAWVHLDIFSE